MNRSFDPSRRPADGVPPDRGPSDPTRGDPRDYRDRQDPHADEERWRQQQDPSRRDHERDHLGRARYETGTGGLPSTYGNVPYDQLRQAGPQHQPWRGRDEEHDFWGHPRHPLAESHDHPSLWERVKGVFSGHGPKNYTRSDERIREDVCEHLFDHPYIDASDIEVVVAGGEVTLSGTVDARIVKRAAEDCAEHARGVKDVHNHLRVKHPPVTR